MKKQGSWFRPYVLNQHNIEKVVDRGSGVYVLGNMDAARKFRIQHIRSSANVKDQLYQNIGKYQVFMYRPVKHQQYMFRDAQPSLFGAR